MQFLIVDSMHPSLFEMFDQYHWPYSYQPHLNRTEILEIIADFEGLIIRSKTPIDETFLTHAPRLRVIARAGAGLDLIDLDATEKRGISVFAANEGNRDAVAEHTVGMLLGLFANINKADRQVRQGTWQREQNRGIELMGKTVGLIGYGFNGSATAQRLSGFGCRVLAYDKYLSQYGDGFAEEASLEDIKQQADIISLHVPLTDETRCMIDDRFVAQVSKPFFLVNIARGEIVSLDAVVQGLQGGKIRGACLDVLENEKIGQLTPSQQRAFDYLCASDKVILTPHIAGWTHESYAKINDALVKQLRAYLGVTSLS